MVERTTRWATDTRTSIIRAITPMQKSPLVYTRRRLQCQRRRFPARIRVRNRTRLPRPPVRGPPHPSISKPGRANTMAKQKPAVEDIQDFAQNIVDTVREPLMMLDTTLRVQSANRAFYQTFHVSPEETENHLIYELGNGQWDIPDLRTLLEDIVPKSSVFNDFELEHTFPVIGRRVMLLNARKLVAGNHGELLVLAMEDVTERRRAEADLKAIGTCAPDIVDPVRR